VSFATAGSSVVRADVSGESRFATLAEVDVAFGRDTREALARLRARYFFRTNAKAKPYVHGRYVGNVAYAITTLPFSKHGPKGLAAPSCGPASGPRRAPSGRASRTGAP